jgi:isopenicillin N synthase-like dioxygenase
MPTIQVVDFKEPNAPALFARSLRETGFGVVSNHPISQDLIDWAYREWGFFFKSDTKDRYAFNPKTHAGYISTQLSETAKGFKEKDLKEFFHVYTADQCPPGLGEKTLQLKSELIDLGTTLLEWIEKNTPPEIRNQFSCALSDMIKNSSKHLFRPIHYPPLTGNEPAGAVRAAAHGDINFITLLPAATAEGLQAQFSTGEWYNVPINPNWIIINAGDMLQECSRGYYPSTVHRVLNPIGEAAKQSRLSMPLFLHPSDDVRLSNRHTGKSYREERYRELGLDNKGY